MRVGESREIKIFVDVSNLKLGFPVSVTTNPSILPREEHGDYRQHIKKIIGLLDKHGDAIPLSVEVGTTKPLEMIAQAREFVEHFGSYEHLYVKNPIGWDER